MSMYVCTYIHTSRRLRQREHRRVRRRRGEGLHHASLRAAPLPASALPTSDIRDVGTGTTTLDPIRGQPLPTRTAHGPLVPLWVRKVRPPSHVPASPHPCPNRSPLASTPWELYNDGVLGIPGGTAGLPAPRGRRVSQGGGGRSMGGHGADGAQLRRGRHARWFTAAAATADATAATCCHCRRHRRRCCRRRRCHRCRRRRRCRRCRRRRLTANEAGAGVRAKRAAHLPQCRARNSVAPRRQSPGRDTSVAAGTVRLAAAVVVAAAATAGAAPWRGGNRGRGCRGGRGQQWGHRRACRNASGDAVPRVGAGEGKGETAWGGRMGSGRALHRLQTRRGGTRQGKATVSYTTRRLWIRLGTGSQSQPKVALSRH